MLWVILAAVATAAGALAVYVGRERLGARGAALALLRTAAVAALVVLLVNATRERRVAGGPATVLLDASLSLDAAGGRWQAARDTAAALAGDAGTVVRFGREPTTLASGDAPDAGRSLVVPALRLAAARPGPVYLVTDGELEDGGGVPEALLTGVTPVVLPRQVLPDAALRDVTLPRTVAVDDSIEIRLAVTTWGTLPDSVATLEVALGARVLRRETLTLPPSPGAAPRALTLAPGALPPGTHVLEMRLRAPGDREPRDDVRRRVVTVGALPRVVLVASPPDWESRFLARELADVAGSAVRAFAEIAPGRWVDMRTSRAVPAARVREATAGAALVVARGEARTAAGARARWLWLTGGPALAGDWYPATPLPASPIGGRLAGVEWDSLPPAAAVLPVAPPPDAWVGLTGRLARRGAERPLLVGRDSAGTRLLTTTADGLWRWALRGGASREAYRAVLAAGVDWLVAAPRAGGTARVSATEVVPRGVPVAFRWHGDTVPAGPVTIALTGDTSRTVALAFDARGQAEVSLAPGVYQWRATATPGAAGTVVVEEYSDEFVPRPVAVPAGTDWEGMRRRVSARETWWVFVIALGALVAEWAWRIRRGLP